MIARAAQAGRGLEEAVARYPLYLGQTAGPGTAGYEMIIDPRGVIREAELRRTSGLRDLDASGLDALCDSRFEPAKLGGTPSPSR